MFPTVHVSLCRPKNGQSFWCSVRIAREIINISVMYCFARGGCSRMLCVRWSMILFGWKISYRIWLVVHCLLVLIVFVKRVHSAENVLRFHITGFDPRMRKSVYNRTLLLLQDVLLSFILQLRVDNVIATTPYIPMHAHWASEHSSEFDWK